VTIHENFLNGNKYNRVLMPVENLKETFDNQQALGKIWSRPVGQMGLPAKYKLDSSAISFSQ
jgi:hypothetical protein